MRGKTALLAKWLSRLGLVGVTRAMRHALGRHLPVLAYHRIYDLDDEDQFPFDPELVSASVEEFRWQMVHLRRHYNPITFAEFLDAAKSGKRLPPRPVIVTFDDGFEDNYRLAFPILRELGVPATIFLATEYIGGNHTFWFDEVAFLVNSARSGSLRLDSVSLSLELGPDRVSRKIQLRTLLRRYKEVSNAERLAGIQELRERVGADRPIEAQAESRPMTWEHAREMAAGGIEFGSHTVTHPILSRVAPEGVTEELQQSKEAIERNLEKPVRTLSYPVGGVAGINPMVCQTAQDTGYEIAVSYISGTNRLAALNRYAMRRLHVERYVDRSGFAAMLAFPELFAR
jgi:peptidoglycan/xylan/chitin deacetylase (PgdA/CDA1 family)